MAARGSHSDEVISLHNEMVYKLGNHIVGQEWNNLLNLFSNDPLSRAEMVSVKSLQDLFRLLIEQEVITFGYYKNVLPKLKLISPRQATLLMDYEKKMQKLAFGKEASSRKRSGSIEEEENRQRGRQNTMDNPRGKTKGSRKRSRSPRTPTDKQKREIHCKMVGKLSEELSEDTKKAWARFKHNLGEYLDLGGALLAEITDMFSACKIMQKKGKLHIGKYRNLIKVVKDVDQKLVDIINEHLKEMGIEPSASRKRMGTRSRESSDSE